MFAKLLFIYFLLVEMATTRSRSRFITSDMSEEMVEEMMNSVESDDQEASDNNDSDPELFDEDDEDDVQSETQAMINNAIHDMGINETSADFIANLPIDLDETVPTASSSTYNIFEKISLLSSEEDTVEVEVETSPQPSTSMGPPQPPPLLPPPQTRFKRAKRARSPLPSLQEDGPSITPGNGGFIGQGEYINSSHVFSLQKEWRIYKFVSFVTSSYRNRKEKFAVHMAKAATAIARK